MIERLRLEKMVYGGSALGQHEGKAVFVAGGIAGEEVDVEIIAEKTDYCLGKALRILKPSPARVEPPCTSFGDCGGCHWQHIDYPTQLKFKEQILAEQLRRIGGFEDPTILDIIGMEEPWHYRHKSRFGLRTVGTTVTLGFYKPGTRQPVELADCPILESHISQAYAKLKDDFKRFFSPFQGFCTVEVRSSPHEAQILINTSSRFQGRLDEVVDGLRTLPFVKGVHHRILRKNAPLQYKTLFGDPFITYTMGEWKFQVQPTSFFQVNIRQAERLFSRAMELMEIKGGRILDGYCGVGVLTLMASKSAEETVGIEVVPSAIEDARRNGVLNGVKNARFLEGLFQNMLPQLAQESWEGIMLDPPREGVVVKKTLRRIAQLRPPKILYVSCNPTTLARDCRRLREGGYTLRLIQPIDMFPHTYHIEALALLERESALNGS
ncbi:MAG: 23S rRNA (uracil(1939)-C(5))-methyltransferase RlmD [Gemmatimonadota bacterium]|nr:MAG: 23S rRNA (uracil(1939)-C(5))-methyltransferase RlmD [Gemmatimonadota bacterium]